MFSHKLVNSNSTSYYKMSSFQQFVPESFYNDLSSPGRALYKDTINRVMLNQFSGVISDFEIIPTHSGTWFEELDHPGYVEMPYKGLLNAFNDRVIRGVRESDGTYVTTSKIILLGSADSWALTSSKSLYKLVRLPRPVPEVVITV